MNHRLALVVLLSACSAAPTAEPAERAELVYLTSRRTADELAELARAAPNLRIVTGLTRDSALAHAAIADGADAQLLSDEFLATASKLRWVQAWSAGVERYLGLERLMRNDAIVFTNMQGVHGPAIAEHVFAMLLSQTRRLDRFARGTWDRRAADGATALAGGTLLVAGLGGIGSEVARRAKAFDMTVLATVRTARTPPAFVDRLGTGDELDALLPLADVVVICLPLTPETERLFDADRLARMQRGARLVNIARGRIVDTDALLAALASGHLAGACLDVTDPEPLPPDHPLWSRDDVVITPHVASHAELTEARAWALFVANAGRFARGEPLENVVDKAAGY